MRTNKSQRTYALEQLTRCPLSTMLSANFVIDLIRDVNGLELGLESLKMKIQNKNNKIYTEMTIKLLNDNTDLKKKVQQLENQRQMLRNALQSASWL